MHVRRALAALAAVVLTLGLSAPTLATPGDRPKGELPAAASDRARQALADVRAIFEGDGPSDQGSAHTGRGATLALRDLMRVRERLTGAEREQADAYLARPAATQKSCTTRICVHYTPGSVSPDGGDANRISDYVDQVRRTVDGVHRDYTAARYRAPLPDGGRGGNNKTDIYLRDIGSQGLYGYCTSEKQIPQNGPYNAWAYCVLDNNYAEPIFSAHTRLENLRVTAAHEYFHAVQFAYDVTEDGWFMEATATWVEDEMFDSINDNRQYLSAGPLGRPRVPLDKFEQFGSHHYGDWIFFRYLTEEFTAARNGLPTLVRDAWRRADGSATGPDDYSTQAVEAVLAARGTSFAEQFALFADGNRRPEVTYSEGSSPGYQASPLWQNLALTPQSPTADRVVDKLDHQASATARFRPSGLTETDWVLDISVDMASRQPRSMAVVTTYSPGNIDSDLMTLNASGAGQVTVPFDDASVDRVEVTLVNASTRMTECWQHPPVYACSGRSRDDNLPQRVTVTAHR